MKSRNVKIGFALFFLLLVIWFGAGYVLDSGETVVENVVNRSATELAEFNYGKEVREYADEMGLPPEYFLSLIVLECGGRKPSGERFEKHVFAKLKQVRDGDRRKYENIKQETLAGASDEAIRNLATSWGPFQLMGYKCVGMDVNVKDIRGDDAVYYGMLWIKEEYGKFLKKSKFKDAFHYHNAGRKYPLVGGPKTHDPKYVDKGLKYMNAFK